MDAAQGEAFVVHGNERSAAAKGRELTARDALETGADGKIRAVLVDASVLAIGAGTRVALSELTVGEAERSGRIDVAVGRFWMQISKWNRAGASRYEIATPNAVAGVRGTTLWGDTEVDAICALEGTIEVRSRMDASLSPAALTAGNCAAQLSQGKLAPLAPAQDQIDRYLDEVLIR